MDLFVIIKYFDSSFIYEVSTVEEGKSLIAEAKKAWPDFKSGMIISGYVVHLEENPL